MLSVGKLIKQCKSLDFMRLANGFEVHFQSCRIAGYVNDVRKTSNQFSGANIETSTGWIYQYAGKIVAIQVNILQTSKGPRFVEGLGGELDLMARFPEGDIRIVQFQPGKE